MIQRKMHMLIACGMTFAIVASTVSVIVSLVGCRGDGGFRIPLISRPSSQLPSSQPIVRVRIAKARSAASFTNASGLQIAPPGEGNWERLKRSVRSPVGVLRQRGRFVITGGDGNRFAWEVDALMVVSVDRSPINVDSKTYPQTLVLHAQDRTPPGAPVFDVVNHVHMERYLPGVLDRELYARWHPTAFAAQAVAARTYALNSVMKWAHRHYDLESTTASQVYGGQVTGGKPARAVEQTSGTVLLHNGRIFPAYYSSSCGGTGQDAVWAFPDGPDIAPLRGARRHDWCKQSKYFHWGPIRRDARTLARRMAAWGRGAKHPVAALSAIRDIRITRTNKVDRPTQFAVTDHNGRQYQLDAEQMRFACNHGAPGIGAVTSSQRLRSSHMQVQVSANVVTFHDGRGFGHGVGLCQWGTQSMAQHGYDANRILATYYPGAELRRLY